MRVRRERLDIFINTKEGEEVGAHLMVLSGSFPLFKKYLNGNDTVHVRLSRFPHEVINAAVEYAYGRIKNISSEVALGLYLLAHNLQSKALVDECTKFLCARIEETNVSEVWSAANATKNEVLTGVCAPLVAMNWEMFRTSRLFHVNTEVEGMMSLLGCLRMAKVSVTSKVKALLEWRNASRDDEVRTARTTAFRDMVSLLGIQDTPDLITDLFMKGIDIPIEWRFMEYWGGHFMKAPPYWSLVELEETMFISALRSCRRGDRVMEELEEARSGNDVSSFQGVENTVVILLLF
ncbi:unnamed protein product [Hymenolepis diminuta]|uniref:BTB domain-containing protein n=1 Tax=Hymenolepis diminuta TaxID=6216 RepID=A0A0R3SYF7_HYMDI|nr:unnamed protein product [Hymenolepis diminuta]